MNFLYLTEHPEPQAQARRKSTTWTMPRLKLTDRLVEYWLHWLQRKQRRAEYPADLFAARRAAFIEQIRALDPDAVDCDTEPVSEEMDLRNSREFPY